jgi:hypothetical protein
MFFKSDLFVCIIGKVRLQSLFCYCTDFENEMYLFEKLKEINKSRYVKWQPVMPGLLLQQWEF